MRFLALDTLKEGAKTGELCERRLAWLADRLAEAPDRPTVILMHHPPFKTGVPFMDGQEFEGADAFAELVGDTRTSSGYCAGICTGRSSADSPARSPAWRRRRRSTCRSICVPAPISTSCSNPPRVFCTSGAPASAW